MRTNAYIRCWLSAYFCNAVNITHDHRFVRTRTMSLSVLHGPWRQLDTHSSKHEAVEVAFHSKALRSLCESETQAVDAFGAAVASVLRHRLADLSAAKSPYDIPIGNPRIIESNPLTMVIDLCDGYDISFCANHPKNPMTENGNVDWQKVRRIKILDVALQNDH